MNNPEDPGAGTRAVPFSRELWIEQDDFREVPPKGFLRLAPGREVRLRYAYFVKCVSVEKDGAGNVTEVHCTYDPATRGGNAPDGRKVKVTMHWVSAPHAAAAEVRLYDRLFAAESLAEEDEEQRAAGEDDFLAALNPSSLETLTACRVERALGEAAPGDIVQVERLGYFCADAVNSRPGKPVFNRAVTLRDAWGKLQKTGSGA